MTASRPAREWVPAGLAVTAVTVGVTVREAGLDPFAGSRLAALVCGFWIMQVSIAAVRAEFRVTAQAAATAVETELALAAEREVAAAVRADRRRFRLLQGDTLPLVRGIAAGHLDPCDTENAGDLLTTLRAAAGGRGWVDLPTAHVPAVHRRRTGPPTAVQAGMRRTALTPPKDE